MVGKTWIVIADDPGPARRSGERGQHFPRARRQPFAALGVVEAVAEAPDLSGAGGDGERGQVRQGRDRIVGRQHLPEPGEPARFLEVEIGDQQGAAGGPEQGPLRQRHQFMLAERKANHGTAIKAAAAAFKRSATGLDEACRHRGGLLGRRRRFERRGMSRKEENAARDEALARKRKWILQFFQNVHDQSQPCSRYFALSRAPRESAPVTRLKAIHQVLFRCARLNLNPS